MSVRKFRPFLVFKVFSYFWLSVVATLLILLLISSLSFVDYVDEPLRGSKVRELQNMALFLSRTSAKAPSARKLNRLIHSSSKRRFLYLKGPTPAQSVVSAKVPDDIDLTVLNYIDERTPKYVFTQHFHAAGPMKVQLADGDFWLYEIKQMREPPLFIKLKLLPIWVKLSVPIFMSLLFAWVFSRTIVAPIRALRDSADDIGKGKLSSRVEVQTDRTDELGELIYDFNQMAQQLESLMGSQKRLLADISHELRSPLTRLSLATGLVKDCSEEKRDGYLTRIEKEAGLLDEMIASVLMLSRLENQQQHLDIQSYSIGDLLIPTLQDGEFEAETLGKQLLVDDLPFGDLVVDKKVVVSAIENILRNAIRYAHHKVKVNVTLQSDALNIVIQDDGPGVADYLLDKLTEPFYRHSESRERSSGGAGLGLAIAKKAMLAHDGLLVLENKPEGGLLVRLTLPV